MLEHGKHKGKTLQEIPISYLKWIAKNSKHTLRVAAYQEWQRRIKVATSDKIKAIGR